MIKNLKYKLLVERLFYPTRGDEADEVGRRKLGNFLLS